MYDYFIYLICIFIALKTLSYSLWSFKNSGSAGGIAVLIISLLCLAPMFLLKNM